jgi:hypothetical protein
MTENRCDDATPVVFAPDPARFRRNHRWGLFVAAFVSAVVVAGLLSLSSPFWLFGVGLLAVAGCVFVGAVRVRWNASPPSVTVDRSGITYRERNLGITRDRSPGERRLAWSEIYSVEIDAHTTSEGSYQFVRVRPLRTDARAEIRFQPSVVHATLADLTTALERHAPQRLHTPLDKRPPTGTAGRWGAALGALIVVALTGGLAWAWGSAAVDGYRATHRGIAGTLVVTAIHRGTGQDAGGVSVTGDFTPAAGGPVRHGVSFATRGGIVGYTYHVYASGPDPTAVYPAASRNWIGNTVGASIAGAILLLAVLVALGVQGIRYVRRSSRPHRDPPTSGR